jgi:hypothetical protein
VLPAQYFRAHPENGCLKIGLPFGVPRVIDLGKQCYIAVESKWIVNRARDNLRLFSSANLVQRLLLGHLPKISSQREGIVLDLRKSFTSPASLPSAMHPAVG